MALSRRDVVGFGIAASLIPLAQPALAKTFVNRTGLRPGQFVWEPSQPTSGPVVIIVSRAERLLHVYRNGRIVGISTCQTGSAGDGNSIDIVQREVGSIERLLDNRDNAQHMLARGNLRKDSAVTRMDVHLGSNGRR